MSFTPDQARVQFSALNQRINDKPVVFLDGPGGSQVPQSVLEKMTAYLGHYNSNLGGHYFSSQITTDLMQQAREHAQALLNAESSGNIIFGANMTSLTFSLSRAISRDWQVGDEVIVTALDHYSNVSSWQQAAEDKGAIVHQARINPVDCTLDEDHLISLINPNTKLVALTYASNTTGSIVNVKRIVEAAHQAGAMVYVDAVHYAPHHLIDVQELGCDFLACSAYKFFGPHVGIAYVSSQWLHALKPYKVEPATNIGPGRFETGTQSFEGLAGVIAAIDYLAQWGEAGLSLRERLEQSFAQFNEHEQTLSKHFLARLAELKGATLYGRDDYQSENRTPTFAIRLDDFHPELVARALGEQNICVWNGHFYALGLVRQLDLEDKGGVVRIGCMHYNTTEEIDSLFDALQRL
ncbi:cysteine desulfurase-like protein [Vibrio fluvialis]|jgi:cysteine desulfurase family protein (TIGR01976 family)|uniref:cysteine desulfurase-like protein n=1 Tax=Vibrio TaxID=662 RepID=UPI000416999E|nr:MULTISPECIES: cysteine desulfurase-like protein [Vibrio]HDM8036551.1 cysteine desulfurase-like protein [Vibrio fluvialis clinical-1]EKO3367812.1 cysteine desulfurase-like protein [Vibrio fluvialis]EKO3380050.1 cysteine desulfurase-like protein [Vibrio fluvialis]EKO3404762.1 cysteine desulfurase-like protein [Vibrio fluvialis]EKO3413134.1 cysteine desulfurase-like protein [Vibrio fluvialis]